MVLELSSIGMMGLEMGNPIAFLLSMNRLILFPRRKIRMNKLLMAFIFFAFNANAVDLEPPYRMKACFGGAFDDEYGSLVITDGSFFSSTAMVKVELLSGDIGNDVGLNDFFAKARNLNGCNFLNGEEYYYLVRNSDPRSDGDGTYCRYLVYYTNDNGLNSRYVGDVLLRFE